MRASLTLGVLGAVLLGRVIQSQLFGVTALDPATYGTVVVIMLLVAGVAACGPSRRVSRLDPTVALRAD